MKKRKLSIVVPFYSVIAYQWDGDSNEFLNTTSKIKEKLNNDLSEVYINPN